MRFLLSILILLALVGCTDTHKAENNQKDTRLCAGIIGGTDVSERDAFGKSVALLVAEDGSSCTATPITSNILLTAAHCVFQKTALEASFHPELTCASGYDLNLRTRKVIATRIHEKYDDKVFAANNVLKIKYDLALVKIEGTIPADYTISRILRDKDLIRSDDLIAVGFGLPDENSNELPRLRLVNKSLKDSLMRTREKQVMILEQKEKGICQGDSGGPQFVFSGGEYKILGVNSAVASGPGSNAICHHLAVLMYVPFFEKWISNTVRDLR